MATRPAPAALNEPNLSAPVNSADTTAAGMAADLSAVSLPTPLQSITLDLHECHAILDPDQTGWQVHRVRCPAAVTVIPDPDGRFWWLCFERLPASAIDIEFIISAPGKPDDLQCIAAELEPQPTPIGSTLPIGSVGEIDRLIVQDELQQACADTIPAGSDMQLRSKDARVRVNDNGNGSWTLQIDDPTDVAQVEMGLLVQEPGGDRYELAAILERSHPFPEQSDFSPADADVTVSLFRDPERLLKIRKNRLKRRKSAAARPFRYDIDLKWSCGPDQQWVETVTVDSADLRAAAQPVD